MRNIANEIWLFQVDLELGKHLSDSMKREAERGHVTGLRSLEQPYNIIYSTYTYVT